MRLWKAPPDGSCFFHSVGFHTNVNGHALRTLCIKLLLENAEKTYNGLTLREWVHAETGKRLAEYARALQRGMWGGTLEAKLLADHFKRPIVIYGNLVTKEATKLLTVMPAAGPAAAAHCGVPIYLLYSGSAHYDALL